MTSLNHQLWELISNHEMPKDATGLPFVNKLMIDQKIKQDTAETAIQEYKKFMYLCATREARNVPSKAVDLVWHLHMQYSRDYWDGFCTKLGKPVHHMPGGVGAGHMSDYRNTIEAYTDLFGTPPKGIWRRNSKLASWIKAGIMTVFLAVGLNLLIHSEASAFPYIFWIGFTVVALYKSLSGTTDQGSYLLTFEHSDPFGDDDAGDCGSGDCGGCGD